VKGGALPALTRYRFGCSRREDESQMAKKKRTKPDNASVSRRQSPAKTAKPSSLWATVVAAIAGAVAVYFLLGYSGTFPLLVAPLIAGSIVGLISRNVLWTGAAGAAGGLVGSLVASASFTKEALSTNFQGAPQYANPDVLVGQLYGGIISTLARTGPITNGQPGAATIVVVATVVCAAVAAGVAYALSQLQSNQELGRAVGGWIVVCALAIVFMMTGWNSASDFRDTLSRPPASGAYAYDAYIYQGAYSAMLQGSSYYQGFVQSASGDSRLIKEKAVRGGKFYSFIWAPSLMREPGAFYLWRVLAPNGPPGVFLLALGACAGIMLLTHWGFATLSWATSLLAPVLVYPILLLSSTWMNIFFPDYWASLAFLASLMFLLRRQLIAALAFALAAALFRETLVIWLIALIVFAALRRKSTEEGTRDIIVAGSLLVVFAALYGLHYFQAGQLIAPAANAGAGGFIQRLMLSAQLSTDAKFMAPMSYMMWPYGFFRLPGAVLAAAGVVGYLVGLRRARVLSWIVAGYGAFWFVYYATIGAASSYWGQQVMPFYLIGVALLVASLTPLDRGTPEST
jgi:hypothetical protein